MQSTIAKKKLLNTAIVLYCLFFLLYFFTDFTFDSTSSYNDDVEFHLAFEILMVILFAPIVEELIFRIPLIKKRPFYIIIFFVVFLAMLIINIDKPSLQTIAILLWLSALLIIKLILKKEYTGSLIWISITIFAVSHLDYGDALNFNTLVSCVFFVAGGCLLTWVLLKYGALKTILFHSFYNLIGLGIYFLSIEYFNDNTQKTICFDNKAFCIEWQQKSLFEETSKIEHAEGAYIVHNATIKSILDFLPNVDETKFEYLIMEDSKIKYDIKIYSPQNIDIDNTVILESLEEAGLLDIIVIIE